MESGRRRRAAGPPSLFELRRAALAKAGGGGGNRTRVPQTFAQGVYMLVAVFSIAHGAATTRAAFRASPLSCYGLGAADGRLVYARCRRSALPSEYWQWNVAA